MIFRTQDDEDEDGELDDTPKVQETVEGKVARHKAKWQAKKAKYQKYAGKGKVEKLERAMERQKAKLQKAKDNGKPDVYVQYKQAKVDFTKTMVGRRDSARMLWPPALLPLLLGGQARRGGRRCHRPNQPQPRPPCYTPCVLLARPPPSERPLTPRPNLPPSQIKTAVLVNNLKKSGLMR